jgi:hypothetical protein
MKERYEIGDLVWLHGKGWCTEPLLVVGIFGDYEHIKVMSIINNSLLMTFAPQALHRQPMENK